MSRLSSIQSIKLLFGCIRNEATGNKEAIRYDSPIFGCAQDPEPQSDPPMFGMAQETSNDTESEFNQWGLPPEIWFQEGDDTAILTEKLQKATNYLVEQTEKHQ